MSVVDYSDAESLKYALRGIDTVISTVTGPNQIELIRAAVASRVRRFAPAEFEGPPSLRSQNDPLDRSRAAARSWLQYYARNIQSTVFVCGILYERFQPGGLQQTRMGTTSGFSGEGDYIMNCRNMSAQVPAWDANNNPNVTICLTAAQDVARFVTRSIDLRQWPPELRMCGQRMAVKDLVALVQRLKGTLGAASNTEEERMLTSRRPTVQPAPLARSVVPALRALARPGATGQPASDQSANAHRHCGGPVRF